MFNNLWSGGSCRLLQLLVDIFAPHPTPRLPFLSLHSVSIGIHAGPAGYPQHRLFHTQWHRRKDIAYLLSVVIFIFTSLCFLRRNLFVIVVPLTSPCFSLECQFGKVSHGCVAADAKSTQVEEMRSEEIGLYPQGRRHQSDTLLGSQFRGCVLCITQFEPLYHWLPSWLVGQAWCILIRPTMAIHRFLSKVKKNSKIHCSHLFYSELTGKL